MIGHNRDDGKITLQCHGGPFAGKHLLTSLNGATLTFRVGEQVGSYHRTKHYLQWKTQ